VARKKRKRKKRQKSLDPSPDRINALVNLYHSGQMSPAEQACRELLQTYPQSLIILNLLGAVLQNQGQLLQAVQVFDKIIQLKPDDAAAYCNRGLALTNLGQLEEAVDSCDQAIALQPDFAQAYSNRGIALKDLGQLEAALDSYNRAIQIQPDYAQAYNNRGNALTDLGQLKAAVDSYNRAIQIQPDYAQAYSNRGNALKDLGQLEVAVDSHDQAIQIQPDYAQAYYNRGNALKDLGQLEVAVDSYNRAIALQPDDAESYCNRGVALRELGQLEEAVDSYDKAIALQPDYAQAHFNLSHVLLLLGDLRNGWPEYEYGKLIKKDSRRVLPAPYPLWNGEPLVDKVILVTAEQGVGDEVMFASCIPDLINLHPKQIILECNSRLAPLLARSFPQLDIQDRRDCQDVDWLKELGDIDFQIAVGSLPGFFRQQLSHFPARRSFLVSNRKLRDKWRRRYDDLGPGMKIGVSWTGGAKGSRKRAEAPSLEQWLPLLRLKACFINLQYGDHGQELRQLEESSGVHIYDWVDVDPLTDLDHQAAQIAELDLVISFDNATVQIAGAIGKKTWVLVSAPPFWMYMLDRLDSPWYPAIKLFRQTEAEGWVGVIEDIGDNLLREIHNHGEVTGEEEVTFSTIS